MTQTRENTKQALPLNVVNMDLFGQHIIEASAGTGKTFNITRIFIRLLLVKEVPVQKVLIVTFTKAATEELRGRIAKEVSQLLLKLREEPESIDDDFKAIIAQIQADTEANSTQTNDKLAKAIRLLSFAALDLDDASIFTIHGFCQRVIKQSAFLRQQSFSPDIVSSSEPYLLQEIQDWFRRNHANTEELELLAYLGVSSPSKFMATFKTGLFGYTKLVPMTLKSSVDENAENVENGADGEVAGEGKGTDEENPKNISKEAFRQQLNELDSAGLAAKELLLSTTQEAITFIEHMFVTHENLILGLLSDKKKPQFKNILRWLQAPFEEKLAKTHVSAILIPKEIKAIATAVTNVDSTQNAEAITEHLNLFKDNFIKYLSDEAATNKALKQLNADYEKSTFARACQVAFDIILEIKAKTAALKQKHEVIDHDDTIHGLASSIQAGNKDLIDYIQSQYPYALIDEFQDTDKDQYSIFSKCYPPGSETLMLLMIGDPKQAIYGFRGGDINTYIAARHAADKEWTMQHNFRSSECLIDAYNVLFYGAKLAGSNIDTIKKLLPLSQQNTKGDTYAVDETSVINDALLFDSNIPYPWIYQGKAQESRGLEDSHHGSIHFFINESLYTQNYNKRKAYKEENTQALAAEVLRLTQEASIDGAPVAYKDIAILVASARQAAQIQSALNSAGLASVYLSEKSDIFESEQALSLFYALDGILHSNQNHKFFRAISTDLFGLSPARLLDMQSNIALFDQYKELMFSLKQTWANDGILVMINNLVKGHFSSRNNGSVMQSTKERILTNYMHLAELLNTQSKTSEHAYQLLNWLKKQLPQNDAEADEDADRENAQRLESDEALIKIVTLHGSKGLEYPIVFIPFAGYKAYEHPTTNLVRYFNKEEHDILIQIGEDEAAKALKIEQSFAEQKRLLYVGITRAVHRCYLGIGAQSEFEKSALFALLEQQEIKNPFADLNGLVEAEEALFNVDYYTFESLANDQRTYAARQAAGKESTNTGLGLQSSSFTGKTGQAWQIESFSKISRQLKHVDLTAKERDESAANKKAERLDVTQDTDLTNIELANDDTQNADLKIDNTLVDGVQVDGLQTDTAQSDSTQSIKTPYRFTIEKSADTGNLLHNILEDHDFSQPVVLGDDNSHVSFYNNGDRICNASELSLWLNEILSTPITQTNSLEQNGTNTFSLLSLSSQAVLKEPEFYFPLNDVSASSLHKLILSHRQELQQDSSASLASAAKLSVQTLQGMMHGFIDLLFMHNGKYYVADYKSNFLGDTQADYQAQQMQLAIQSHNYDLQYLIYCWALDKYLQARLPDYKRSTHFGGVYYLFLRGMSPNFTLGSGVYSAHISEATWLLLDEAFNKKKNQGVAL
jgi:exodeoxyribonuclease V beta subunit